MLRAILKKEVLVHIVSFRFIAISLVLLALTGLAAWVGTEDYLLRVDAYNQLTADNEEELGQIHVYSYLQPVIARPPEPMSIIDLGFEGRLAKEARIDIHSIPTTARVSFRGNELMALFLSLDLTTIVRLVFGLLAFLLTFDSAIGERESGNLKLVLSSGVRRSSVIAGKFLGAFSSLLIPLALCLATTLAVLYFHGQIELSSSEWWRLLGLVTVYIFYLSLMVLLGLTVSLVAESTSASLVISLFFWLTIVVLVPQAAIAIAGEAMETANDFGDMEKQSAILETELEGRLKELYAQYPLLYERNHPDRAPVVKRHLRGERRRYGTAAYYDTLAEYNGKSIQLILEYAGKIYGGRQAHQREMLKIEHLACLLASPSPAFLLDRASEAFAGTSAKDFDRFFDDARTYRLELIAFLEEKNAFASWRWFTDDLTPRPWTELVVTQFPDLHHQSFLELSNSFRSHEVQEEIRRQEEQFQSDPERLLHLVDLPRLEQENLTLAEASANAWMEIAGILALNLIMAMVALTKFEKYRIGSAG